MKTIYAIATAPLAFPLTGVLIARWFFGTGWLVSIVIWLVMFWIIMGIGALIFRNDPEIKGQQTKEVDPRIIQAVAYERGRHCHKCGTAQRHEQKYCPGCGVPIHETIDPELSTDLTREQRIETFSERRHRREREEDALQYYK